jgi:hypothetical protein
MGGCRSYDGEEHDSAIGRQRADMLVEQRRDGVALRLGIAACVGRRLGRPVFDREDQQGVACPVAGRARRSPHLRLAATEHGCAA